MTNSELNGKLNLRDVIESFSPHADIQHALLLTYSFEGSYIEDQEQGLLQLIWQRDCTNIIVIRDCKAIIARKQSHRYNVVNASYSSRIFHPKLILLLSKSEALAIIGSANLTHGGLAKNLELSCEYHLTHDEGPHHIFEALHDYIRDYLRQELDKASSQERNAFDDLVSDLGHFLEDTRVVQNSSEGTLSFIHNYDKPIFDKILEILPGRELDALWIVSPFFESEAKSKSEDPDDDKLDDKLIAKVFKAFKFTRNQQHHMRIYFQASSSNTTALPLNLLKKFKQDIALYKKDPTAIDQRTLHAKMFVFIGRKPTGERFMTIVHGSANFTGAALLSKPPHGNAEIVIATQIPNADVVADSLADYLNLEQLFNYIENWDSLIQGISSPPIIKPIVQVWEGMIFLEKMIVQVYFKLNSSKVKYIRVTLCGDQEELFLGDVDFSSGSKDYLEFQLPFGTIKTIDPLGDLSQLPFYCVRLDVFDSNRNLLGIGEGALNVDRPELFRGNYLCRIGELSLANQIFNAGGGFNRRSTYSKMGLFIEKMLSNKLTDGKGIRPTHQANLDQFFSSVHTGLRGLRWEIEQSKGSLHVLGRDYRMLATWGIMATQEDQVLTPEMRLYLCDRIVRTVLEITEMVVQARNHDKKTTPILRDEFLIRAESIYDFVKCLQNDEDVGLAADNLLKRWYALKIMAEGDV